MMYYVLGILPHALCIMYYVLCIAYYVLCIMHYVQCIMYMSAFTYTHVDILHLCPTYM